jgi:UrcA family protein
MKMLFAAAVAAVVLCSPASAASKREPVTLQISTQGVDFSDPMSVDRFRSKAANQISDFCNPEDRIGVTSPDRQCSRELSAQLVHTIGNLAVAQTAKVQVRN